MTGFLEALWSGDMTRMAASEMLLDGADPGQAMIAAWARFMRTSTQWTRLDELVAGLDDLIEHCVREGSSHGRLMAEVVRRLRSLAVPDPGVLDRAWPAVERINEAEPGSVIHDVLTTGVRTIDLRCRLNLLPDHEARRTLLVEIGDATDRAERGPIRFLGLLVLVHWWPLRAREAPGDPEALDEAVRWTTAALADLPGHAFLAAGARTEFGSL